MKKRPRWPVPLLCLALALPLAAQPPRQRPAAAAGSATSSQGLPPGLEDVGFDQRLGEAVPADLTFRDETGAAVELGDYLGRRPLILALVYYECPMLCTLTMNGLTGALKALEFDAGEEFEVLAVSFDPGETPALAARAKEDALARYGRPETAAGWHFLTGSEESVRRLTEAVGFRYVYDPERDEYAHASGIVLLTPEGRLARYFYGVDYPPRDLRLGLVESAESRIGSVVDQVLLFCFHYDPATGKYSAVALNLVRLGGAVTLVVLLAFLLLMWRREGARRSSLETA